MRFIIREETDPWFNIAAEEHFLKNKQDEFFMLWRSEPSVIIGKHQNALAEINMQFVRRHKLPVIRRITGGGTVYHDEGNLNFTFIRNAEHANLVDFRKQMDPVIDALRKMGLPAEFHGRNNILMNGLKVSGNSEHIYKNRVLHHGTLLFASNLEYLDQAINPPELKYHDKAVRSLRSRVGNISGMLDQPLTIKLFTERIMNHIRNYFPGGDDDEFTNDDHTAIDQLAEEKYRRWEWNYGYSPKYTFRVELAAGKNELLIELSVRDGIIQRAKLTGTSATGNMKALIPHILEGIPHEESAILATFRKHRAECQESGIDPERLAGRLF